MKKFGQQLLKILISGCLAVILLSCISLLYDFTGVHLDNPEGDTDYVWASGQYKANLTEGISYLIMDENGHNNTKENVEKAKNGIDILLIGSSHVEGLQVAADKNMGYLMNRKMPEKTTYSLGVSGHTLYRVLDNVDVAVKKYKPGKYLIVETDTVEFTEDKMLQIIENRGTKIVSYDSGLIYYVQSIPAVKWIYKQFSTWKKLDKKSNRSQDKIEVTIENNNIMNPGEAGEELEDTYQETLNIFLSLCATACREEGCTPIIFYHPTGSILENGKAYFPTSEYHLNAFRVACEENGIIFVDLTDVFTERYYKDYVFPHGFVNTVVGSGHLNEYGHEMVADTMVTLIKDLEEEK